MLEIGSETSLCSEVQQKQACLTKSILRFIVFQTAQTTLKIALSEKERAHLCSLNI